MKILILLLFFVCNLAIAGNFIPPQAFQFRDTIRTELDRLFPEIWNYNYVPALIEHESCITLRHRRCWSSTSRLKSDREEGAGLGQVTRAFRPDGSVRFDSLTTMAKQYRIELREARWETIYQRPDIQIRIIILMLRADWKKLHSIPNLEYRMHMVNAAYNGGLGGVLRERRACGLAANCDPNIWFNNVEKHCLKSRKALYGTRSACDINRHHTKSVFKLRLPKYIKYYFIN